MRQTLELQQRLQTTLTPELQQVLRIMQLSSTEIQQQLQTEYEENPFLEIVDQLNEDDVAAFEDSNQPGNVEIEDSALNTVPAIEDITVYISSGHEGDSGVASKEHDWSDQSTYDSAYTEESYDVFAQHSETVSLQTHLRSQVQQINLSDRKILLLHFLIDALNSDGYLFDWEDITNTVSELLNASEGEIESTLEILQDFTPSGVGSRSIQENLFIQLRALKTTSKYRQTALDVVQQGFSALTQGNTRELAQLLDADEDQVYEAIKLIRSLNPRPGAAFADISASYIVPDVVVSKRNKEWQVTLNDSVCPKIKINDYYVNLINKSPSKENKNYMKQYLLRARSWIYGLRTRNSTLLKTAIAIVSEQKDFFESGETNLRPLTQAEIALIVGVHPSTVSRITTQKYLSCNRGTFELKYFFSSHIRSTRGDDVSSKAIQAQLKQWTDNEDPSCPFSDADLVQKFRKTGVTIARRTITKYRQNMNIPSSRDRGADSSLIIRP